MKKRFSTTLDADLIEKLKIQAVKEHRSAADIIEEALGTYFKNHH